MSSSPDLSAYADLTLYDKNPQDLFDTAITLLETYLPGVTIREGHIEAVVLEAMAAELAETVYALNRLPGTITQILAQLYGVTRDHGTRPTATLTFTLSDTAGHTLPQGTQVRLDLGAADPVIFTTTAPGLANPGETTIVVAAQGDRYTADANGVAVPTDVAIIDAIYFVESAQITTAPVDGAEPEDTASWLNRFITVLSRLTTTLALPSNFTAAALADAAIYRATTLDDWNAGYDPPQTLAAAPSATGGTLQAGAAYGYEVTAVTAAGETLPTAEVTATIPAGGGNTGSAVLTWQAPAAQQGAGAVTGYKVYRTTANGAAATIGLIATLGNVLTYTDTGGTAPAAAPPVANTTGQSLPGYVTVAVYGQSGPVASSELTSLAATLSAQSLANLSVRVVNATVTTLNVTITVVAAAGYATAAVQTAVSNALSSLLSPSAWPWAQTVRRNEIIAAVGSLPEVAYVDTLTAPAADVTLPGVAPLVQLGTATVTVT